MVDFIYKFKFTDCQRQSAKSDLIRCPNHPSWEVDLHQVASDIMLHDVDPDLLLSHEDVRYEDADSSILKLGVRSKTSSYFFAAYSRFAFILFRFFAVSSALAR